MTRVRLFFLSLAVCLAALPAAKASVLDDLTREQRANLEKGDLVVLEQEEDGLRGGNYTDAVPHFTLKAWPAADGRVRIDLVPVIRHGPMERSFVGEDGAFRVETSQRKRVLDPLRCEVTVPADGLLIVGPAGDPGASVGDALFRPRSQGRTETRLLALRPLAPGVDPMFASKPAAATDTPALALDAPSHPPATATASD